MRRGKLERMELWDRFRVRAAAIPPTVWAVGMLVVVLALGAAATSIDRVQRFDTAAVRELQGEVAVRGLQEHVFAVTDLGGSPLLFVGVTAVVTLLLVGRWRAGLAVALAVALTKAAVALAKEAVERPRPETAFGSYDSFSFPSGHSASAAALYMTFAVLLARDHRGAVRALILWLGALLTVVVGLTRILLGAHFPTDVLAGWLVGALGGLCAWALVVRVTGTASRLPDDARV